MGDVPRKRQQWKSKLGFVFAASGSAIGLGNIVFFGANAYKYGAGAFYLPYLVALFAVGIPLMVLEFGLGRVTLSSFPLALGKIGGRWAEAGGWWALVNALLITAYYITILGWVTGMWWRALGGSLWEASVEVPAFGMAEGALPNPVASFFDMISGWDNVAFVLAVWVMNLLLLVKGTKTIEPAVKVMLPLMWIFMIVLVVRGLTLDGGIHGVYLLFAPNFQTIADPTVWHGAFSQIFFTLSLGFGIMTTYASYLDRKADHVSNAVVVSCMNCSFEMIAGLAVFSLLFAFALTPKASTLAMMFFIVPSGIAQLPVGVAAFGALFFTLLLLAGLSSSISLVEACAAALIDKFRLRRVPTLLGLAAVGIGFSTLFALPMVVDRGLASDGTLGLTLLDLTDHYTFGYGLIVGGLIECIVVGWVMPARKLREAVNEHSRIKLGPWFDGLVRWVMPAVLLAILVFAVRTDLLGGGLYGHDFETGGRGFLPAAVFAFWLVSTSLAAVLISGRRTRGGDAAAAGSKEVAS